MDHWRKELTVPVGDAVDSGRLRVGSLADEVFATFPEGSMKLFHVCMGLNAEGGGPCNHVMASSALDTGRGTGCRWHCLRCGGRLQVRPGVLVELTVQGTTSYYRARYPPWEVMDGRGLRSSAELACVLPPATPVSPSFLRPESPGCFKIMVPEDFAA